MDQTVMAIHGRSKEVADWVKSLGIENARRVVIDIDVAKPVMIYVEQYASLKMIEVDHPFGKAEIRIVDKPNPDPEEV